MSDNGDGKLELTDGDRVGVIGGGPAGSLFAYFLKDIADRVGIDVHVDIIEAKEFSKTGPGGCNMCGGIVSESLVQTLATEGINLPENVVKRGIESYVLHVDEGQVRIDTPLQEMRIAAVHRGCGPKGMAEGIWHSFDGYLMDLAVEKQANLIKGRVDAMQIGADGRPEVSIKGVGTNTYDLAVVAAGVNGNTLKMFDGLGLSYRAPATRQAYITEYDLGVDVVEGRLGGAMHVFLLDIPGLDFAALIPKAQYVTLCMLGRDVDKAMVAQFLSSPEVRSCFPDDWEPPAGGCHCSPHLNIGGVAKPYADRMVFIGDAGVSRLNKDGMSAAYRTAKAAAITAVFDGISEADFSKRYWSACRDLVWDNRVGRIVFAVTHQIQKRACARRGLLRLVKKEQDKPGASRRMSRVLWDTFTGSASYRNVFKRTLHPLFLSAMSWNVTLGLWPRKPARDS